MFFTRILATFTLVSLIWTTSALPGDTRSRRRHVRAENTLDRADKRRSSGKVGLAWSNGEDSKLPLYVTSNTQYLYTWSAFCPNEAKATGIECCRMLWGPDKLSEFRKLRTSPGTKTLMGMNEVNEPSQANMSPGAGVKLWNEEIRPFGLKGYRLISPAVTSAPSGIQWFKDFFASCGNYDGQKHCGVDIMAIHYYGTQVSAFEGYVTQFHNVFGIPIWVTEFACENFSGQGGQCSKDDVWTFMIGVTAWMNATPWVEAYFAFGLLHDMWNVNYENQLMDKNGNPTDLGRYFLSA